MKKTALILVFLVCFIGCQGFARGSSDNSALEKDIKKINEELTKINGELGRIKDNNVNTGNQGDTSGSKTSNQGTSDRIPVNYQIVQFFMRSEKNSEGLKFYLSKPFTLKISEQNDTKEIENRNNMIIINPASPANEIPIEFPITSEGILIPGLDQGSRLRILFQQQGKTLIFTRNVQQNNYELSNIEGIKDYKSNINEPIQLMVLGQNNRKSEVQAFPVDFAVNNNAQPYQNLNTGFYNDNYTYNTNYNRSVNNSRTVMGSGSINKQRVIEYVRKNNRSINNSDIAVIDEYFRVARDKGVNVDLAIAQMLYATNNLKRVSNNNYGGLKDCRFRVSSDGVLAHIQHLLAYAQQDVPVQQIVDTRFKYAWERGSSGITFDQVYLLWAPQNPSYRWSIEKILRDLY